MVAMLSCWCFVTPKIRLFLHREGRGSSRPKVYYL